MVSSIRIIFFFLALFPLFASQASGSDGNFSAPVFVIPQGGPTTIPAAHLEFLEGADETVGFEFLEKAEWAPKLVADQSLVEGYWVRLRVQNTLPTDDVGIKHNFNKEKRIFARHSDGVDEYPYWSGSGDSWIDEGRINAHYLVTMPQGEITTIYNFFRSKPFDRYYSKVDGLDRITIGKW
ncbi:MAG: adenylate/guanylate cyclase domain-containing protein, partial [Candidatus Puniceispirillaceae bacterium]